MLLEVLLAAILWIKIGEVWCAATTPLATSSGLEILWNTLLWPIAVPITIFLIIINS